MYILVSSYTYYNNYVHKLCVHGPGRSIDLHMICIKTISTSSALGNTTAAYNNANHTANASYNEDSYHRPNNGCHQTYINSTTNPGRYIRPAWPWSNLQEVGDIRFCGLGYGTAFKATTSCSTRAEDRGTVYRVLVSLKS